MKKSSTEAKEKHGKTYRPDLPKMPVAIRMLPVERGFPIPWFVAKIDGMYDFRVVDTPKIAQAVKGKLCWICGQPIGRVFAFVIGPMCAINRIGSEPPMHRACAEWSARACPFLTQRQGRRREGALPDGLVEPAGNMIMRQPGVALIWITDSYKVVPEGRGVLFQVGEPLETAWVREGRTATREEVLESIESGYPILEEQARRGGPVEMRALEVARERALQLVPA